MQRKADESTFSFEVNARPTFKDGKSEGNLRIYNPPYNKYVIEDSRDYLNNNENINNIRDVIIHLMLLMQKLNLRNMQYGDDKINQFIDMNNYYLIKTSYDTLFNFNVKKKGKDNIIKAYEEFNKVNMVFNG